MTSKRKSVLPAHSLKAISLNETLEKLLIYSEKGHWADALYAMIECNTDLHSFGAKFVLEFENTEEYKFILHCEDRKKLTSKYIHAADRIIEDGIVVKDRSSKTPYRLVHAEVVA